MTDYSVSRGQSGSNALAGYESTRVQSSYRRSSGASNSGSDNSRYTSSRPALDDDAALLTVAVPSPEAKVIVNGHETTSTGTLRKFMSRGLKQGHLYTYVVDVSYQHDGQTKSASREVKLRPGDSERVEFTPDPQPQPEVTALASTMKRKSAEPKSVVTVVRLNVPADARVNLAGNPTEGEGAVRTFRTTQLAAGERWTGYKVVVTAEVNGQSVSQEQTLDVAAGSTNALTFEFDEASLAKR